MKRGEREIERERGIKRNGVRKEQNLSKEKEKDKIDKKCRIWREGDRQRKNRTEKNKEKQHETVRIKRVVFRILDRCAA